MGSCDGPWYKGALVQDKRALRVVICQPNPAAGGARARFDLCFVLVNMY